MARGLTFSGGPCDGMRLNMPKPEKDGTLIPIPQALLWAIKECGWGTDVYVGANVLHDAHEYVRQNKEAVEAAKASGALTDRVAVYRWQDEHYQFVDWKTASELLPIMPEISSRRPPGSA
jgi:hypothetical protein